MLAVAAGAAVLLALFVDVFTTVFRADGRAGFAAHRLYRSFWWAWVRLAPLAGSRRRSVLALGGPLLMPLTLMMWATALVLGFALIYLPFGDRVQFSSGGQANWATMLYLSGYSASTLGVGDVYFDDPVLRLLTTLEAGWGFALFTVTLGYLISVYNALLSSAAVAVSISTFLGRRHGNDALDLLADVTASGREDELMQWIATTTTALTSVTVAQQRYPLVHYFHTTDDHRALPVVLDEYLRLLVLARTVVAPSALPALTGGPTASWAQRVGGEFLATRMTQLGLETDLPMHDDAGRVHSADQERDRLLHAGVPVRSADDARHRYVAMRRPLDDAHVRLLGHFGYRRSDGPSLVS